MYRRLKEDEGSTHQFRSDVLFINRCRSGCCISWVVKPKETTFHTLYPSLHPSLLTLHCLYNPSPKPPFASKQAQSKAKENKRKEMPTPSPLLFLLLFFLLNISFSSGTQLIVVNNCNESIWPGILGGAGHPSPEDGGFHLSSGEEVVFTVPNEWSGRIWGRQGCCFDTNGRGSCETGDCAGLLQCKGMGGTPPATVVEMTFGSSKSQLHYYDVSLVDGFNLPVTMIPVGGGVGCGVAACEVDLNVCCPSMLEVKMGERVVGCKSACMALKSPKYCCTEDYASPKSCKPTVYSNLFKAICPRAYSFAYDDSSSLRTCRAPRYVVTFCPPTR